MDYVATELWSKPDRKLRDGPQISLFLGAF